MRLIIIESPYAGATQADVETNLAYARAAMADCLRRGDAPYASHALYTQAGVLDDLKAAERKLGMEAGFKWGEKADVVAFYTDRGISPGMIVGYNRAKTRDVAVDFRSLPEWFRPCAPDGCADLRVFGRCASCGRLDPKPATAQAVRRSEHRRYLNNADGRLEALLDVMAVFLERYGSGDLHQMRLKIDAIRNGDDPRDIPDSDPRGSFKPGPAIGGPCRHGRQGPCAACATGMG